MSNITTDVLRAQCAELRQQLQALTEDRDRWRDHSKAMLVMLPERLERTRQNGMYEAYTRVLAWCRRHGGDAVEARVQRELSVLLFPAPPKPCDWCAGCGYVAREGNKVMCPCCNAGMPRGEERF